MQEIKPPYNLYYNFPPRVREAKAVGKHDIQLAWRGDRTKVKVNVRQLFKLNGVFTRLRDPKNFKKVSVARGGCCIEWRAKPGKDGDIGDIDIGADTLWEDFHPRGQFLRRHGMSRNPYF